MNSNPAELRGRVPSARQRDDGDDDATDAGLRLSTATMTEVDYGGGGHRTRLRNDHKDQLVCLGVPPAPVYKGVEEGRAGPLYGAP